MTWLEDASLSDLEDNVVIERMRIRCLHVWLQSPLQFLIKVSHRDAHLDEVAKNLACPKRDCPHVGARRVLMKPEDMSGFEGDT